MFGLLGTDATGDLMHNGGSSCCDSVSDSAFGLLLLDAEQQHASGVREGAHFQLDDAFDLATFIFRDLGHDRNVAAA